MLPPEQRLTRLPESADLHRLTPNGCCDGKFVRVTDAAHGAVDDQLAVAASHSSVSLGQAMWSGVCQPIVAILVLIALFTTISGKPLDGFLMLTVAMLLVWDAARYRLRGPAAGQSGLSTAPSGTGHGYSALTPALSYSAVAVTMPADSDAAALELAGPAPARATVSATASPASIRTRKVLKGLGWPAAGGLYAWVVGSFSRYSWPATTAVVAVGCLMVAIGWQGPLRQRRALTGRPLRRASLWGVLLVTGGLWELSSLLQQPHLTTDSYAHPTISALTDPLLVSHPGRSLAVGGWLVIGWFLVGR